MEGFHHISTILVVSLLVLSVSALDEDRNGRCPPLVKWGVCPTEAPSCSVDKDCGQDMRCCESPCGGVCTKPLFTGCEHLQMAATRRARALGPEGRSVRIPRCNREGDFDPVQCDNEIVGSCWCVDEAGFELPGTRAPAKGLVNCTAPAACAAATCRMLCPHGFTLAQDGCPQCHCRDPCAGVRCPSQLSCQLEEVACLRQPCPPVPTCKRGRSLDNICPVGDPLMISDTHRPFLCGTDPGKPSCPPLYQCLVQRGNDYGVCCPASLKIQKPGMCPKPAANSTAAECDAPCAHDLECPSMQKCCQNNECGKRCVFPDNLTECLQQKALAEALSLNEREGRGYIPQCSDKDGAFQQRQCSRNGLVCWCVNSKGLKSKGSMGPSENVDCSKFQGDKARPEARSLTNKLCDRNICASICEYGFRVGADGCPSCECDDPCDGFPCKGGEECIPVKEQTCQEDFCPTYPVCRPKVTYVNPCMHDAPLTNDTTGEIINCDPEHDEDSQSDCPSSHRCIQVANSAQAVCCPSEDMMEEEDESEDYSMKPGLCPFSINQLCDLNTTRTCVSDDECEDDRKCCLTSNCGSVCADADIRETPDDLDFDRSPSMCEYLRDFNDKMEGTHDGMKLALSTPECHANGSFSASQCAGGQCWCVDSFGTEVPATRANGSAAVDCVLLRETSECLELTCRLGCDYGFVISPETQCPLCQCRNPCQDISCGEGQGCQMVEVACDNDYCPPVPACLPQKAGECPYLVPSEGAGSCDYACQSDAQCEGEQRCCSNGCGTHCVQPIKKTACQHQRAIVLHKSAEEGIPGRQLYVPACREADGTFELVQCHEAKGTCWCVDQAGLEISGTRTNSSQKPQCQAPSACPTVECTEKCEHGYALDSQGCSSCLCRDPCEDTKCYEGEVCKVIKVECVSEPCPPVALCVGKSSGGPPACGAADGTPARRCGPSEPPCPSSHKCHLPPLTSANDNPPVCCPKPRSVCFDPKDEGHCPRGLSQQDPPNSTVRWHFSPEKNQCLQFRYEGCSGNHNNFQNEQHCNTVCPVLSQCERLREKNQKAAIRYKKDTFIPRCRSDTGEWEAVQCMEHIGVCWCASGRGEPLRGSLVRGQEPACNFRQARRRIDFSNPNDDVLEELVRQMTAYNFIDSIEETDSVESIKIEKVHRPQNIQKQSTLKSRCLSTQERLAGSSAAYEVTCDSSGRFNPSQCESSARDAKCWCVDEAGNQLPGTSTFSKGDSICLPTPIEAVDITLGFFGDFSAGISKKMKSQLLRDLGKLGATLKDKQMELLKEPGVTYIHFTVIGNNKVDIAYHLEELVKQEELSLNNELVKGDVTMVADIRKSTFHHKLGVMETKNMADNKIIALQHREILSESTVSVVTSYHTAIIVLAAASAFIISTMSVLLMLYRKKVSSMGRISSDKVGTFSDRFVPSEPPVYVLSRQEKEDLAEAMKINDKMDRDKV